MDDLLNIKGKRILVTGASSGLGSYFVAELARRGAQVMAAARRRERLESLVNTLTEAGASCAATVLDVTDAASVVAAFDEMDGYWGRAPDVVINNAGVAGDGAALELTEAQWDSALDTNLKGAFLVSQEAARRWVGADRPGSIINIASILGLRVASHLSPYAASKAGLIQLSKAMALELARHQIRINVLAPGYVETDINRSFFETEPGQRMIKRIPQRRLGQKRDLLAPLCLLASDASTWITGSVLTVDGGHSINTL